MKLPIAGGLLFSILVLAGCAAPMTQREAQGYAQSSLRRYCAPAQPCHFVKAQHMPTGWLLDYDSAGAVYGVMVRDNGGTDVSVWDKSTTPAR
jgi:hypothetical protein